MGKPANFVIVSTSPEYVVIADLGPWDVHFTVTNDAESVVRRLAPILAGRRLFYHDSDGELDELVVRDGKFKGFAPGMRLTMTAPIGLATAGQEVELAGVKEDLLCVIASLDRIHQALFAKQLVITSARDGQHAPGSLHAAGLAVDLRTADKEDEDNLVFLNVLTYTAHRFPITVFDERNLRGAPHIHVEWHGA